MTTTCAHVHAFKSIPKAAIIIIIIIVTCRPDTTTPRRFAVSRKSQSIGPEIHCNRTVAVVYRIARRCFSLFVVIKRDKSRLFIIKILLCYYCHQNMRQIPIHV